MDKYTQTWKEVFDLFQRLDTASLGKFFHRLEGYNGGQELPGFNYFRLCETFVLERHLDGSGTVDSVVGGKDRYLTVASRRHRDQEPGVVQRISDERLDNLKRYVLSCLPRRVEKVEEAVSK